MAGRLLLLTPIASPMVTRPTSPSAAAAAGAGADAAAACTGPCLDGPGAAAAAAAAAAAGQASRGFKSPPCCSGCGAAKASGGMCSGCGGAFCRACMGLPANSSGGGNMHGGTPAAGCSNCHSLCNACKPVACCFCEDARDLESSARLCEACAGVCDACQRAACEDCRAVFGSCSSCGYAACEDCRLQLQLQFGSAGGGLIGPSGAYSCWCAPPLRMASNLRHVSSQRYQMAQLHPSVLARTMEATGLRDADYDEDDVSYDEDDVYAGQLMDDVDAVPGSSGIQDGATAAGAAGAVPQHRQHGRQGGGSAGGGEGFGCCLSPKRVEALIGSLPAFGGGHLGLPPLSPSGSTHSSTGQFYVGSLGAASAAAAAAGMVGFPGLRQHQEHGSLRSW